MIDQIHERLFTSDENVSAKQQRVYLKQIKQKRIDAQNVVKNLSNRLIKRNAERQIERDENAFSIDLSSSIDSSTFFVSMQIIKSKKFFSIKIIDEKSDKYNEDDYLKYFKYIKQMKLQFSQNDVEQRINESNRKKLDYAMTFLTSSIERS